MRFVGIALLSLALASGWPGAAGAQVDGTWGFGVLGDYDLPAFKLNEWFPSGGPKVGGVVVYVLNERWSAEVEGHYARYGGGALEDRKFLWSIDKKEYASPQAKSDMVWTSGVLNWVRHFKGGGSKLGEGGAAPYFVIGSGFYRYRNKVSGLIWPGQNREPLNQSVLLRPVEDRHVTIGAGIGFGVEYFVSRTVGLDLRGQYNLILGSVRPMEAWGMKEVFPFQKLDIGVRFKLYLPK